MMLSPRTGTRALQEDYRRMLDDAFAGVEEAAARLQRIVAESQGRNARIHEAATQAASTLHGTRALLREAVAHAVRDPAWSAQTSRGKVR